VVHRYQRQEKETSAKGKDRKADDLQAGGGALGLIYRARIRRRANWKRGLSALRRTLCAPHSPVGALSTKTRRGTWLP